MKNPADILIVAKSNTRKYCKYHYFNAIELILVRTICTYSGSMGRGVARYITMIGNGWIYVAIFMLAILLTGARSLSVIGASTLGAACVHSVYPTIKRRVARPRPFHFDSTLPLGPAPKDLYSFPSGHTMTLSAVLCPFVQAIPGSTGLVISMIALMSWARVASAHHYPTDVCSGALLGAAIGYPISVLCV